MKLRSADTLVPLAYQCRGRMGHDHAWTRPTRVRHTVTMSNFYIVLYFPETLLAQFSRMMRRRIRKQRRETERDQHVGTELQQIPLVAH